MHWGGQAARCHVAQEGAPVLQKSMPSSLNERNTLCRARSPPARPGETHRGSQVCVDAQDAPGRQTKADSGEGTWTSQSRQRRAPRCCHSARWPPRLRSPRAKTGLSGSNQGKTRGAPTRRQGRRARPRCARTSGRSSWQKALALPPPPLPRACIATYWARPNARTEGRAHTGSAAREPNAASSCTHAHESTRCSPATAPARPPRHIVALVTYARSTTL